MLIPKPSACSHKGRRTGKLFRARSVVVADLELPAHAALVGVGLLGPGPDLRLQQRQFADAPAAQASARQATQLAFGDVQPTAVLGRVAEVDPLDVRPRSL